MELGLEPVVVRRLVPTILILQVVSKEYLNYVHWCILILIISTFHLHVELNLEGLGTTSWGFWATFEDGKTYKVPIVTDLPGGKNYYCIYRPPPTACASRNDWDERCEWDQTYHPNRFQ